MEENKPPQYNAKQYAKFRPTPPQALFDLIYSRASCFDEAWDCGCGNGQASVELAKKFKHVIATDLSEKQIQAATQRDNIDYEVSPAEQTSITNNSIDLITVSQALHWFNHVVFKKEVKRVLKKEGVLAAWGYGYLEVNEALDPLVVGLSRGPLDHYWAEGRDYLENQYRDIPFPFEIERHDEWYCEKQLNFDGFMGWLESWSAHLKYLNDNGVDVLDSIKPDLLEGWGDPLEVKTARFPIYLLLGKNR